MGEEPANTRVPVHFLYRTVAAIFPSIISQLTSIVGGLRSAGGNHSCDWHGHEYYYRWYVVAIRASKLSLSIDASAVGIKLYFPML